MQVKAACVLPSVCVVQNGGRWFKSFTPPQGPLAQQVEQWTFNPLVLGSSPRRPNLFNSSVIVSGVVFRRDPTRRDARRKK